MSGFLNSFEELERAVASAEASDWNTSVPDAVERPVAEGAGCKRSEKRGNSGDVSRRSLRNLLEDFQLEDADATHAKEFAAFIEEEVRINNEEEEDDEEDEDDEDDEEYNEEKKEKVCQIDCSVCTVKPLFQNPDGFNLNECPICYEKMEMINVTIARCGHTFHASCLFRALELKTDCPMCRIQLINEVEDDEDKDEDEDEYDDDDDLDDDDEEEYDDEDIEDDSEIRKVTHEQLANKLTNIGYTPADFLRIAGSRVKSETDGKYVCAFFRKFREDVDNIISGEIRLVDRDTRTYAQVVKSS